MGCGSLLKLVESKGSLVLQNHLQRSAQVVEEHRDSCMSGFDTTSDRDQVDARELFGERHAEYDRFIRLVRYRQGLRAFFVRSSVLAPGLRVLDAGCGTGAVTFALREALVRRQLAPGPHHAFDLTPAMLDDFRRALAAAGVVGVETRQADVLQLTALPDSWRNYDLIVSASMLEYVPRRRFAQALEGLRERLRINGQLVLFITRRNWLTRPLIGRWWRSGLYTRNELQDAFDESGFEELTFAGFPLSVFHLGLWGHAVIARR